MDIRKLPFTKRITKVLLEIEFDWNAVCPNWLNFASGKRHLEEKALTRKITQSYTYVGWSAVH